MSTIDQHIAAAEQHLTAARKAMEEHTYGGPDELTVWSRDYWAARLTALRELRAVQ